MLTERRIEVLKFIASHIATEGYPPTRTLIARELGGVSRQQAKRLVDWHLAAGYLRYRRGAAARRGEIAMAAKGVELLRDLEREGL